MAAFTYLDNIPVSTFTNGMSISDASFRNFSYTIAANPSSIWPVKKMYHYNFLRVCWHLKLVSLIVMRSCADVLQERTKDS